MSALFDERYSLLYEQSTATPELFWDKIASEHILWISKYSRVCEGDFSSDNKLVRWFPDGLLNASFNCLDRHERSDPEKTAIIYANENFEERRLSYRQLLDQVCRLSNFLVNELNVKRGENITIYMSMVPEAVVAMLACARIGAVHNVVFGGFSFSALRDRVLNCKSRVIIACDVAIRHGRCINLFENVARATADLDFVSSIIVHRRADAPLSTASPACACYSWDDCLKIQSNTFIPAPMDSEDPLFILYTSGSTGKPKAVVHTTAGYLVYVLTTTKYVFNVSEDDKIATFADIGWITGHSYIVYGPLLNGITTILYEGSPLYPSSLTIAKIIELFKVTQLYTAPTVIRLLKQSRFSGSLHRLDTLKVIGSVGEPLDASASLWYKGEFGPDSFLVDTYWQSETGGHMITGIPGFTHYKPGCTGRPFFGIKAHIVDDAGNLIEEPNTEGSLVFSSSWPSMARSILNDHSRFIQSYFSQFHNYFYSGDRAFKDEEGYFYIRGRMDDVINSSGHRLSSAEIESAACDCQYLAECAAVGKLDEIFGEVIWLFCILKVSCEHSLALIDSKIKESVQLRIGSLAVPKRIIFINDLPKTRSGKIMRRLLKKLINEHRPEFGDISTLSNPESLDEIKAMLVES